jgi:hypothetical protein
MKKWSTNLRKNTMPVKRDKIEWKRREKTKREKILQKTKIGKKIEKFGKKLKKWIFFPLNFDWKN